MALAHSQVFSFYHWSRAFDGEVDGAPREWWYRVKEAFVAAGWTVMGSHNGDGVVANDGDRDLVDGVGGGAGTDHFVGQPATSGLHVWWVVQCPPIMGVTQVRITNQQNFNANPEYATIDVSPTGSFMAINGGTDGTTLVGPAAPDEVNHLNNAANGIDGQGDNSVNLHACWSADKSQFFMMVNQEAANAQFFAFSVLENPDIEVNDGLAWCIYRSATSALTAATSAMAGTHYTSPIWHVMLSGVHYTAYLGGRGWANLGVSSLNRPQDNNRLDLGPCEIYVAAIPKRGFFGRVPDLYWGPLNQFQKGMGAAVGGPITWYSGGSLVVPWDSSEPLPRIR
jgi:hypothetical protein